MSASMLVSCVGVVTCPGLCPIGKETASAAPTLCAECRPSGWMDGTTINSKHFIETLKKLKEWIWSVWPDMQMVLPQHIMHNIGSDWKNKNKKIGHIGFTALQRPPDSPDLASSDFHLFPKLKELICGEPFSFDMT